MPQSIQSMPGLSVKFQKIQIWDMVDQDLDTVFIGEEDTMVNKILVVDKIVHLGPPLGHCRGLLYKIVW